MKTINIARCCDQIETYKPKIWSSLLYYAMFIILFIVSVVVSVQVKKYNHPHTNTQKMKTIIQFNENFFVFVEALQCLLDLRFFFF